MKILQQRVFLIIFTVCLILIIVVIRYFFMGKQPHFIVEVDKTKSYSNDIIVNYNSINTTNGYHRLNRIQTLLSKGKIYEMEPQESQIIEYYIKSNNGYVYQGQWNLEYDTGGLQHKDRDDDNRYKLIITPTENRVIFSNYRNGIQTNSEEFEYSPKIGKNYFNEPTDLKLFTKFSLPKTSKFEPYLANLTLEKLKKMSKEDFKKNNAYLLEKYVNKLNLNEEELNELRSLGLIKID